MGRGATDAHADAAEGQAAPLLVALARQEPQRHHEGDHVEDLEHDGVPPDEPRGQGERGHGVDHSARPHAGVVAELQGRHDADQCHGQKGGPEAPREDAKHGVAQNAENQTQGEKVETRLPVLPHESPGAENQDLNLSRPRPVALRQEDTLSVTELQDALGDGERHRRALMATALAGETLVAST